jgi:membrane associated rhomboid family serine protease
MGIYDREYYRREGPSALASFVEGGKVCKWLIAINIVCLLLQLVAGEPFTEALILNVDKVLHGQVWRLLTHAFLHGSFWHIFFNMLFLWWFGRDVETVYGHKEFLAFYLTSAVVAGLVYLLATLAGFHSGEALGASGAVTAVLILCALHFPRRIILLFFVLPVPIWAFALFAVAKDAFDFFGRTPNGIATSAHLGGAAFAYAYYKLHWRLSTLWPSFQGWRRQRSRPRLRIHREEEVPEPVGITARPAVDEHLEAEMDAILEKISRTGKESLTDKEREVLLRASEIYRNKRH